MLVDGTVADVHRLLRERNALVVHFSGTPKGVGVEVFFPDDLQNAIANPGVCELACSTVMPGDCFYDPVPGRSNCTGTIGIVLDLESPRSLMAVCETDAGSPVARHDREVTLQECVDSIVKRSSNNDFAYNEWNLRGYIIRGIFVADPIQYYGLEMPKNADGTPVSEYVEPVRGPVPITVDDIRKIFPKQKIYSFVAGHIVEHHPENGMVPVSHEDIYL